MSVKAQHADYASMAEKWKRCRDVAAGQDAVHKAGSHYLPRLKDQTPEDYTAMVQRAVFYGATWRTIAGLVGMLFRKPADIDAPESLMPLLDDVTLSGVPLQSFAQDIAEQALTVGRVGVLCDFPVAPIAGATMLDAQKLNLRPTLCAYRAESIINWRIGKVNNKAVLSLVVLEEKAETPKDEFESDTETQYRVLDLDASHQYRVRLFRINKDGKDEQIGEDILPTKGGARLDYIPFVFIGVDDVTPEVDEPPLIDLVNMNVSHYKTTADYEHGCHFAGLPTAVVSGYSPSANENGQTDKLYIGSATAWVFPDPQAKAMYLEFTGQGLGALKENLDRKEQQMAVLGARMLEALKRGVESAQTASIHRVGEESLLSSISQSISMGLTRALGWFSEWAGSTEPATIELNRDFYPVEMTPLELTALVGAWQAGAISKETLFDNLKQGELISSDSTFEDEEAKIANAPPTLGNTEPTGDGIDPTDPTGGTPTQAQPIIIQIQKGSGKRTVTGPGGQQYTIEEQA